MNKLTAASLEITSEQFRQLVRYLFDDPIELKEDYIDRDECRMTYLAQVDLAVANDAYGESTFYPFPASTLVGNWQLVISRTDSNGIYWDELSEIVKVEQVTETKTVTYWKPIPHAEPVPCSPQK